MKKRTVLAASLTLGVVALVFDSRGAAWLACNPVERDVVYGIAQGYAVAARPGDAQSGDGPFPAVVFLHGGGWRAGNRQEMNHFIEGIARLGYVGITVEYRLVPAARFPAQVEDCKAAVRWLRANAGKYRIHPDRIGVVGFSAGGHLASMLGVTASKDGFEGAGGNPASPAGVQAVVSFFGPTDFSTRDWPRDLEEEVIEPFLGGSFARQSRFYRGLRPSTTSPGTPRRSCSFTEPTTSSSPLISQDALRKS